MTKAHHITPKVSVIVAAYNQEKFIGRCLRSLLHQTMRHVDYEIIVVDDGSTDLTPYALELFYDAIISVKNEKNLGLPAALNKGIRVARGNLIVRVDADDYVGEDFLMFLYTFMKQNEHIDAIACDYWLFNDQEKWLERKNCLEDPIGCGIMFRKSQLLEIGLYDDDFRCHEDRELRIRFEKKYKIYRLELPLYRYRRHDNNMTNNHKEMKSYEKSLLGKHPKFGGDS